MSETANVAVPQPESRPNPLFKRPLDLFIILGAHLVLLPIFLFIWITVPIAIWLGDRGQVFFRQARVGKGGRSAPPCHVGRKSASADRTG